MEIWKDIPDYEGIYQVSNMGRLKRLLKNGRENFLCGKKDKDGYVTVILSKNQKKKYCRLHRVVASAFAPNPDNKKEVNHIDKNKQNNEVSNLEWVTTAENIRHSFLTGRKTRKTPVLQFTPEMELVARYPSIKEASEQQNVKQNNISACCRGRLKTVGGYIWRYKVGENA